MMLKIVTYIEGRSFEISKHKNSLQKPSNPQVLLRSLEFVVYQNLEYGTIAVSNLAKS